MSKKFFLSLLFLVVFVCCAGAEFGITFEAGGLLTGSNNLDKIKMPDLSGLRNYSASSDQSTGSPGGFQIAVFYDVPKAFGLGEKHSAGVKLGYVSYGNTYSEYEVYQNSNLLMEFKLKSVAYALPLTFYYKYDLAKKWKVWGGAGMSLIANEWYSKNGNFYNENKFSPHVDAGIEWRFSKLFGLELNMGYQFDAKFESGIKYNGTEIYNDLSGFLLNFAFKVHIF